MPEGWEEIRALLALRQVEGLGHQRLRRLLAHFGLSCGWVMSITAREKSRKLALPIRN